MADKHKRLKQYSVIAGGKMSKVINFSKGEAVVFVKNFIESRLSHAVIKQIGGMKDIKAFFTDTNFMKTKLGSQVDSLISGINKKLEDDKTNSNSGEEGTAPPLTEAQKTALTNARTKLSLAKTNIQNVDDDSDFNKENIQSAKNYISDSLDNLTANGITSLIGTSSETVSSGGEDSGGLVTIDVDKENRQIKNGLNTLRKWQFDIFEEEYSAELWIGTYHEYKYAKEISEMCELISTAIKSQGAELNLNPELYRVENNELVRTKTLSDLKNLKRYATQADFPSTRNKSYIYYDEETETAYKWIKNNDTDPGHDEVYNFSEETVNIEEDIKKALRAANVEFERIDVDWHNSNEDPESEGDNGFSYP